MKKSNLFISAFSLIAVIFISQSLFVVSEVERAVKLRFGEIVQFDVEPGLHFKCQSLTQCVILIQEY